MVHYLFWLSAETRKIRTADLTLDNLNDCAGFSGTETCIIEMAAEIARRGHRSTIFGSYRCEHVDPSISSLVYAAEIGPVEAADIDVVIPMMDMDKSPFQDLIGRIRHARLAAGRGLPTLVVWCHCFPSLDHVLQGMNGGGRVALVGVSDWVAAYVAPWAAGVALPYRTIENALSLDVYGEDQSSVVVRQPRSVAFHATYERGGSVACRVHRRIQDVVAGPFNVASYYILDNHAGPDQPDQPDQPGVACFHGSLSKRGLAKMLWASDYFVYPLVLPSGFVHHDTFACVVLEALACGVLVVTWDVACMRSVYGATPVVLVPPPPHLGYDPNSTGGFNFHMQSEEAVETLAQAVRDLEALPVERRDRMRAEGRAWALRQTWEARAEQLMAWVQQDLAM